MHYTLRAHIEEIIESGIGADLPTHMIADEILHAVTGDVEWFKNVAKFTADDVTKRINRL